MDKWSRLLVSKALWLYGFTIILPYICFLLLVVSTPSASQTENIFYPAVVSSSTLGYIALFTLGLLLMSAILHARKSQHVLKWLGIAIFVTTIVILGFWLIGSATGVMLVHEDSEWIYGAVYHLAADPYSTPYPYLRHTLFQCGFMGLMCRVVE